MNINDYVYVQLTSYGKSILRKYMMYSELRIDYEVRGDWFEFQLWKFMNIFGSEMFMGNEMVIENGKVELENPAKK